MFNAYTLRKIRGDTIRHSIAIRSSDVRPLRRLFIELSYPLDELFHILDTIVVEILGWREETNSFTGTVES